jgi:hypothetical protein
MFLLSAVHLHPAITLFAALAMTAWISWYWRRLGRDDVPHSRRKIRRYSLASIALSLVFFVRVLSFIERATQPRQYMVTWSLALLMVMIVIVIAMIDALNNLRLLQAHTAADMDQSARELIDAIKRRRTSGQVSTEHEPLNGQERHS